MYEDRTYENILQEMLEEIPDGIDKREGSVIFYALAPAARRIAQAYAEMDRVQLLSHAQTSSGDELRMRGADFGIDPQPATKAIRRGEFSNAAGLPFNIPLESRFAAGGLVFVAKEKIEEGAFRLECETAGAIGNIPDGALLPIDYISGLSSASLTGIILPGEDDETDESFRQRLLIQLRTPPTSGNRAAYRKWALEVPGVGDAYVIPVWSGPNTVKVVVVDSSMLPASAGIVQAVKDYVDPNTGMGEGMGEGAAPGGQVTTVVAAAGVPINVVATISRSGSRTLAQIKAEFEVALAEHLADIARNAFGAYNADRGVKYARIGTVLLDIPGVADYSSLTVNGGTTNIPVAAGAVAIKGTVTLNE